MRDIILIVLMLVMFGYMLHYKKKAEIMEKGFVNLAKMAYALKTKEECFALAGKLCKEIEKNEHRQSER